MSDQEAAMNRLLKKLSGVRATLNRDERDLLDGIVLNARYVSAADATEVEPHAFKNLEAGVAEVTEVETHAWKSMAAEVDNLEEVQVHAMKGLDAEVDSLEEVQVHSMKNLDAEVDSLEEVQVHAMKGLDAEVDSLEEVQVHSMKGLDASVNALENAEQEVVQHSMSADKTLAATVDATRDRAIGRIQLDADEVYRFVVR